MNERPDDRDALTAEERARVVAEWKVAPPPDAFAESVAAAWTREQDSVPRPKRRLAVGMGLAAAVLTAVATQLVWPVFRPDVMTGDRTPARHEEIWLGKRAVAATENGAVLRWRIDLNGPARIEQDSGNVFYRVNEGGPFEVVTPAGTVSVTGTCFRVEVISMGLGKPSGATLTAAAIGAAVAVMVTVTVYEGKVRFANAGGKTTISAGESASASPGVRPWAGAGAPGVGARAGSAAASLDAPAPDATREALLARDDAMRRELATLRARLVSLESERAPGAKSKHSFTDDGSSFFAPTKDELVAMAKRCELRMDIPSLEAEPYPPGPELSESIGLTAAERDALLKMHEEFHRWLVTELQKLYAEVTGDETGGASLSAGALGNEITEKSPDAELQALRRRIAEERAGLVAPPADLASTSPLERYTRLMAGLGDEYEHRVASVLGPARARALRADSDGWPSHWKSAGCKGE
jgi:hypothetical protein